MLEREIYTEAGAARLLRVPRRTLHFWLDGGRRCGNSYGPVIRSAPMGAAASLTWSEFVEAAALRCFSPDLDPRMNELRVLVVRLRDELGVPHPLADRRPYTANRELVFRVQHDTALEPDLWLVADRDRELALSPPAADFLRRVDWLGDCAIGWRPADNPESPVRIRPDRRFGRPAVGGISTEVIWGHADSGEDEAEIAAIFDLSVGEIEWAVSYEATRRAA
ncbi:MAG: hypothetical protein QOE32_2241 [Pseudonocardiales bacterium]|nr:hypothetical protein [Pseudonocardiales bacterium]MDT7666942.1 hypothetical protein [Pseudonocardiales bacterium]